MKSLNDVIEMMERTSHEFYQGKLNPYQDLSRVVKYLGMKRSTASRKLLRDITEKLDELKCSEIAEKHDEKNDEKTVYSIGLKISDIFYYVYKSNEYRKLDNIQKINIEFVPHIQRIISDEDSKFYSELFSSKKNDFNESSCVGTIGD